MKKFEKVNLILIVIALFGILACLFIEKIEIKDVQNNYLTYESLNVKDRENGICADMYAEGFEWGLAQYKIEFSTMFFGKEYLNEQERALKWYRYWNEKVIKN